jgi:hypothetical protein
MQDTLSCISLRPHTYVCRSLKTPQARGAHCHGSRDLDALPPTFGPSQGYEEYITGHSLHHINTMTQSLLHVPAWFLLGKIFCRVHPATKSDEWAEGLA